MQLRVITVIRPTPLCQQSLKRMAFLLPRFAVDQRLGFPATEPMAIHHRGVPTKA
jgi:hypothetical protein